MPQFDITTFIPQLFWMLVMFGVLYVGVASVLIPRLNRIGQKRFENIDHIIAQADAMRLEGASLEADMQGKIHTLRQELVLQSEARIKQAKEEIVLQEKRLFAKMSKRLADAEAAIETQQAQEAANLQKEISRLRGVLGEKLLGSQDAGFNAKVIQEMETYCAKSDQEGRAT